MDKEEDHPNGGDEFEKYKVENFVNDGKHYSHHHPLRLMSKSCEEEVEVDDKQWCMLCGLPILSCPSYYTCTLGCKFFLHKPCALEFPTNFIHPSHGPSSNGLHALYIRRSSTHNHFTYECESCSFTLHPLVAFPLLEIKTKHMSHISHSLVASHKETLCECDACGRVHRQSSFFFHCGVCNFWIHPDCAVLPNILKFSGHPYPFIIAYSLPSYVVEYQCFICEQKFLQRHNGVYFCPQTLLWAHVGCLSTHESASQIRLDLIQLPDDDCNCNWDTILPSSVIRRYPETIPLELAASDIDGGWLTIQKIHNHPLILSIHDEDDDDSYVDYSLSCDLCTRTVTNNISFYKCSRGSCHFSAHKICVDVLPMLRPLRVSLPHSTMLSFHCPDFGAFFFNSVYYCACCRRPCNGLCYPFSEGGSFIDLECIAAPSTANHASHTQHLLFRTTRPSTAGTALTCCPSDSYMHDVYRCTLCDYYIHTSCAMLPKTINVCHEYDEHPLCLAFNIIVDSCCRSFCEVCEEAMDLKYWSYRCGECDKWFHINCIPSVGYLSKVKFGGTISLPNAHADHPLALTRMLNLPTQRCGYCKQIIHGLLEHMAFFCKLCYFWLHFSCARDAAAQASPKMLKLYSEVDIDKGY